MVMVRLDKMVMKQKISIKRLPLKRISLGVVAMVVGIAFSIPPVTSQVEALSLDEYNRQIQQLQGEINQFQSQARDLRSRGDTIQVAVDALNKDIAAIQVQINIAQAKVDHLKTQIALNEQKIKDGKSDLGETIANMYVDDEISPLEMLASSKNISEYVDKQEFRSSVRDRLTSTIAEIKKLKSELEKQKVGVEYEIGQQKNSQLALDSKRAEQQQLLDQTRGDEAAYQRLASDKKATQTRLSEQYQAALRATFSGSSVLARGVDGDYPWNSSNCPMVSPYAGAPAYYSSGGANGNGGDGYGYGCRQCASYAAWRVAKETGRYPSGWGNAINFPAAAERAGYTVSTEPRPGSLGVMNQYQAGVPEGHVVWVESVIGSDVIISQYNYDYGEGYGKYSQMRMSSSKYFKYIYIL